METESPFFIRLVLRKPLSKDLAQRWFQICRRSLPTGVLGSLQVNKPDYGIDNVQMVLKNSKSGKHIYEIPLNRDLLEREVEPVVKAWDAFNPQGDFDIETSATQIESARQQLADAIVVDERDYNDFCETLAKHQHGRWCRQRQDEGWRYGLAMDPKERTHPLLRPWEDLPAKYQSVDYDAPRMFIELLNSLGYDVVKRKDKTV